MSREVLIATPENVAIEYELAGLGTRFCANFLDMLLMLLTLAGVFVVIGLLAFGLLALGAREHVAWLVKFLHELGGFISAGMTILSFVVFWGYFIYFEFKWNGQTPGKRASGLRIVREGGYPVDLYSVILRNLLRIIDFLPGFYFIGIASITLTSHYQRLGDLLGGTLVVKQRAPQNLLNLLQSTRLQPEHLDRGALALIMRDAERLTPEQYRAVRHFTERRRSIPTWEAQQNSAMAIAVPLMHDLGIAPPQGVASVNYADVLEYLAVAYETARRPKDALQPGQSAATRPGAARSL